MSNAAQPQLKPVPAPAPVKPSRMALTSVIKGRIIKPIRVTIYGGAGVGKSTFGASAPNPIFIGAEDGTAQLDVARFPKPETFADVFDAIRQLYAEKHDFKTLVVDSLDWIEPIIWRDVVAKDPEAKTIEEVSGGYGKGYTAALDEWRRLLSAIERLQAEKHMHVVFIAHGHIKKFTNPEGPDYDRYQLKLNDKAAGIVKEWSDAFLFARHETVAHTDKKKRVRGVDTGARVIHTNERAAFDAKNRYSLPDTLPLSWPDFFQAVEAGRVAEPSTLKEEIARKAKELGPEIEKSVTELVAKAGDNAQSLALINNRLNVKLAEKLAAETPTNTEEAKS